MQIDQRLTMYTNFLIHHLSVIHWSCHDLVLIPVYLLLFRSVATPTVSRSCRRTSTGMRNPQDASGPISPCPNAGRPPPRGAASSGHLVGPSAPACCRSRPSAGSTPMERSGSIWHRTRAAWSTESAGYPGYRTVHTSYPRDLKPIVGLTDRHTPLPQVTLVVNQVTLRV